MELIEDSTIRATIAELSRLNPSKSDHLSDAIKTHPVMKCLDMFANIAGRKVYYMKYCEQFDKCSKLGIQEDMSGDEQLSLKQYVDRMQDGLNDIYSVACESIAVVSSSPFGA